MFTAALCFGGGFLISALGVHLHQLWLIYLGYGVLGGCGLGLGYISPVKTLITWFPDRPGMATGLAIMGSFAAAPHDCLALVGLADAVLRDPNRQGRRRHFRHARDHLFLVFMMIGAVLVRSAERAGCRARYVPPAQPKKPVTTAHVHVTKR